MTTKRLLFLQIFLLGGLSTIFFLPKISNSQPSGVVMQLPDRVGEWNEWVGYERPVTEKEREVLGVETEFARKTYANQLTGQDVDFSIVLAGRDMNTSIHRPERCFRAQGMTIVSEKKIVFNVGADSINASRLYSWKDITDKNGVLIKRRYFVNYYWFVGHDRMTNSHFGRAWLDMKDRMLKGINQRWAYIMVTSPLEVGLSGDQEQELQQADTAMQELVEKVFPSIHQPS